MFVISPARFFDPDGQNPRRHPRGPRVLGRKISQNQKNGRFFKNRAHKVLPKSSQGIAEKFAGDSRNFVGGRRNTRRSLGAASLYEILTWKGKSCN